MFRHMIHGTIIVAEVTTQAAICDAQAETWLLAGTLATLARVEKTLGQGGAGEEESYGWEAGVETEEPSLSDAERSRFDRLFSAARQDRSKAYELKAELDRLEVFDEYEDAFLDLFRSPD